MGALAWDRLIERWDWRVSAHARLATLASAWLAVLLWGPLGGLIVPFFAVRTGASTAQSALNLWLGRRCPVTGQTKLDWALVGLIIAGVYAVAIATGGDTAGAMKPGVLAFLLMPFSVLQLRMAMRSYAAHAQLQERLAWADRRPIPRLAMAADTALVSSKAA